MITDAIRKIVDGRDLSRTEAVEAMNEVMGGEATDAQIAALITALRMKGETPDEISGCAAVMREKAVAVKPKAIGVVDTCGTGGDMSGTFNISTTAAFVVAGAGVPVAKHGNRSVSSSCGSADLLEALGVNLGIAPETVAAAIDEVGIGFLFAPALHLAMKYAIGPRKQIGIRTIFNVLGPLTNPAGAEYQVLGVYSRDLTETIAEVLLSLGTKHALVVHGDGLDEITTTGRTKISEVNNGEISTYEIDPEDLGLPLVNREALAGGSVERNVEITRAVLAGEPGPARDIVMVNASAALVAAEKAADLRAGIELAAESLDSGRAAKKLTELIAFTNK
jgi:anthranilate phosphoribosyltransferase